MTEEKAFDGPKRVAINRVFTRKGDAGKTALVGGQKVSKCAARVEAYGAVDELNSFVGAARQTILEKELAADWLLWLSEAVGRVQQQLFNVGSVLATLPEEVGPRQPCVRQKDIDHLEAQIERCNLELKPLRSFVLPGGTRLNTDLHLCRVVCRRAERACVALAEIEHVHGETLAYLNRLSDAFFVWSRWAVAQEGVAEVLWDPNAADEE